MESKSTWEKYSEEKIEACYKFCEGYKDFLSNCKTERECVETMVKEAISWGYRDLDLLIEKGEKLKLVNMEKSFFTSYAFKKLCEKCLNYFIFIFVRSLILVRIFPNRFLP